MQMAKVGRAMCEGETGQAEEEPPIDEGVEPMAVDGEQPKMFVKPQALKHLVGKGHPEFSTMRQQVCFSDSSRPWGNLPLLES